MHRNFNIVIKIVGKHPPELLCKYCDELETTDHIILLCKQNSEERKLMMDGPRTLVTVGGKRF